MNIVGPEGPSCARMTVADYAARPLSVESVPEFTFSPKKKSRSRDFPKPAQAPAIYGPPIPAGLFHAKPIHEPVTVSASEASWRQLQPVFQTPVTTHNRPPVGTAPTLEGLGHFLSRVAELQALIDTQRLELPTVGQELAATGMSAISISSSSSGDDDDDSVDIDAATMERHACRYGTAYVGEELAPIVRRIEWERYIFACGEVQRVIITERDGQMSAESFPKMPDELVAQMGNKLYRAMGRPSMDDLRNARARVAHYGVVGSILYGTLTGEHAPEQTMDDLTDPADERRDGPKELRFHELDDAEFLDVNEPPETVLWPVTIEEVYYNLTHNIPLSAIEWSWLERNAQDMEALRAAGLVS